MRKDGDTALAQLGQGLRSRYEDTVRGATGVQKELYPKLIAVFDLVSFTDHDHIAPRVLGMLAQGYKIDPAGQYELIKYIQTGSAEENQLFNQLLASSSEQWVDWVALSHAVPASSPWAALIIGMAELAKIT
ncbi:MAG: hypothetical protein KBD50_03985 [Candidatus Pacebacteria bacterium]|nr:hypothetical protein [Candidatus Paceibacterota bacterium]